MVKIFVGIIFISLCGLGGWYLANPDMWNNRDVARSEGLDPDAAYSLDIESVPIPEPLAINSIVEGEGPASCSAPATSAVTARESVVFRWTDADGQIHFGDKPPASGDSELYDVGQGATLDYFDLDIDYRGDRIVPYLESLISAQATGIYEIMARLIGKEHLRHVGLNIVIFPDAISFRRYAQSRSSNSSPTLQGIYLSRTNEAVTYTANDDLQTMEVTRHEATHVIARGIFGTLPVWMNEGFAEYFSKLSIQGQLIEVASYEGWPELARATLNRGYPASLADFLNLSFDEWHGAYQTNHYALSWAFVYFMLETEDRRQALAMLMQEMAQQFCQPRNSAAALARLYPGGLSVLEREFYTWVKDAAPKASHIY